MGGEHDPYYRQIDLIAQSQRIIFYLGMPDGHSRSVEVDVGACRGRIVRIT